MWQSLGLSRQLSSALASEEQVRQERIEDIKARIEAGTYNVSSTDVAEAVVAFARDAELSE